MMPDEEYIDNEEEDIPQHIRNNLIESNLEYYKWRNDPAAVSRFKEITKDIPLSNLTKDQEHIITEHFDVLFQIDALEVIHKPKDSKEKSINFIKAMKFLEGQIHSIANVSLGRGGFARIQDTSQTLKHDITKDDRKKKGWKPFSGKR